MLYAVATKSFYYQIFSTFDGNDAGGGGGGGGVDSW